MDDKIIATVKIDFASANAIASVEPGAVKAYIESEIAKEIEKELTKMVDEEVKKLLYGEGGYLPEPTGISLFELLDLTIRPNKLSLLDFNSMHPSMWVDYSKKPKNHYERMMLHRRIWKDSKKHKRN